MPILRPSINRSNDPSPNRNRESESYSDRDRHWGASELILWQLTADSQARSAVLSASSPLLLVAASARHNHRSSRPDPLRWRLRSAADVSSATARERRRSDRCRPFSTKRLHRHSDEPHGDVPRHSGTVNSSLTLPPS